MSANPQRLTDIAGSLAGVARAAARARADTPKWASSVTLTTPLEGDELQRPVECASVPCRRVEGDELVWIDFDFDARIAAHDELVDLLTREIEPFIIGAGQVRVQSTEKGIVIRQA
jgi:hypothetical protein